jgi:hypothetical protein
MTDLPPLSQVLTLDCSNIQWITPVYGFLGSTINQSINQSKHLIFCAEGRKVGGNRVLRRIFEPVNHEGTQQQSFAMTK